MEIGNGLRGLGLGTAFALLVGCGGAQMYAVETRLIFGDRGESAPEVIASQRRSAVADRTKVALVWPSDCANETSAAQRGDADTQNRLAAIDCAVEMTALERVLVSAGYQVFHWDSIRRRALAQDISPEAAAEQLGIGILLRVNSMERAGVVPGGDARWQREYYQSDRNYSQGPSIVVAPYRANQLERMVEQLENEVVNQARLAVTLDVTAVHVPSGEVSWFYRWTHQDAEANQVSRRIFVLCQGQLCSRQEIPQQTTEQGPRSGSTRALSTQQEDASASRATYARLMFEAINDLVQRLAQLEEQGAPAAAPAPRTQTPAARTGAP